ncbi:MAG TPA: SpoIID/LytB domain-containing protein [Cyanobacteria bacterium UBA11149]|nr:SpoIID/LytB domain-containing protein [Cyanobacteria bacterium UBA11367]HBE58337.1 SpoIID/LytB domain-containing protein [Cyanobacteria bacterium UBA11366]HBK65371.1 SpoIID/LytB domain-containing protein [Cyanobacteria bacterium UBA11166]HBR74465.1 SpoIID/LytB domain-containing protein [Cyanobacteria bacterium UBA11159]HBS70041.1 SpoIID/LytB domain-containing protein [Cyanobacteria bacterium UBA11153]HBW91447.1 SpoIID/LytB domain-containing protein [Cyanobacteria bacterium UBA11149]HCA9555
MNHLSDRNPVVNKSIVWTISLVSVSLFVPWMLAQSLPPRSVSSRISRAQSVTPSLQTSPQSSSQPSLQPSPQEILTPSPHQIAPETDWHQDLVSRSLLWQYNPPTTPRGGTGDREIQGMANARADKKMGNEKNHTPTQGYISKQQTLPAKASVSHSPTQTQGTKLSSAHKPSSPTSKQPSQPRSQQAQKSQNSQQQTTPARKPSGKTPVIEMRVAIADGVNSLAIATSTPGEIVDARGKLLDKLPAKQAIEVLPGGPNIRVGKWTTPAGVWIKPSQGGLVFVNNRWYRGDVLLVSQGNNLLAVNYVELEAYISSVVGSEVYPNWPMDALKAQAIAARSYAIVHYIRPANRLYDLGNTQRWQVYKGIETEWNTTLQAAQETRGIFLSYKGGVVESMYAASDDIVANVFGGQGMSQNGAYKLATQGYNYQQILNNYYPGASLAWLDATARD